GPGAVRRRRLGRGVADLAAGRAALPRERRRAALLQPDPPDRGALAVDRHREGVERAPSHDRCALPEPREGVLPHRVLRLGKKDPLGQAPAGLSGSGRARARARTEAGTTVLDRAAGDQGLPRASRAASRAGSGGRRRRCPLEQVRALARARPRAWLVLPDREPGGGFPDRQADPARGLLGERPGAGLAHGRAWRGPRIGAERSEGSSARRDRYEVLPGQSLTAVFTDANGKEIARQEHRTNDYGSFSGSFTAPRDRLLGTMVIRVDGGPPGQASVSVEEYKRPKFYVTLDAP